MSLRRRVGRGTVYRCHWYPFLQAAAFVFVALVGLAGVGADTSVGGRVFGGILAAVSLFFAVRGARAGTVVATDDSLVIRNVLRTHRVPYEEIRAVETEIRPVGPVRYRRSCLVLVLHDGTRKVYTEFNSPPGRSGHSSAVEVVAEELDALIRRRGVEDPRQPCIRESSAAST